MDQRVWDIRFLGIARVVGTWSRCLSRPIGAVLTRDNHIISTGYNGAARGVTHCEFRNNKGEYCKEVQSFECPRKRMGFKSGEGLEHCPAVHAEANTIAQAARYGIATEGTTLYCDCPTPCTDCAKEIINAGIKRVVCTKEAESRPWSSVSTKAMFEQAGVEFVVWEVPQAMPLF